MSKEKEKVVFNSEEWLKNVDQEIEQLKARLYQLIGARDIVKELGNADERVFGKAPDKAV